ncbi:MAG: hypothetical protein RQ746_14225 [Bacteroidales bacterium]|nr:hypothetical protein [Bacteroidales bacterium]
MSLKDPECLQPGFHGEGIFSLVFVKPDDEIAGCSITYGIVVVKEYFRGFVGMI